MMNLQFDARIDGNAIAATITADRDLAAPVWCFSLMAPARVLEGAEWITGLGGYAEVRLPDLKAGRAHRVTIAHANPDFRPVNRAWLPLGGYLRLADGACHPLPALPAGIMAAPMRDAPDWNGLPLIPQPTGWEPAEGVLAATGFAGRGEPFAAADALSRRLGFGGFLDPQGTRIDIHHDPSQAEDAYVLEIAADGARLSASGRGGLFYGAVTLVTLIQTCRGRLPCGRITDRPRFGWRGQHLDCARHFYTTGTITRLMDLMALLKLNRFHWHFADDEGFRLETDALPDLWRKTAFRGEGEVVPGVFGGGIRSGGSYSRAEVAALVAHGRALNIEILPEVEVPAHALALNRAVPGLRDPRDTGTEASVQGYPENAVNPAMPATFAALEPLLAEVADLFPLGILHLGCDELAPGTWDGSPAAAALKQREGLGSRDDLQGWMMERLAGGLTRRGIRPAAWEEAARGAQGGIGHGALMFSWTGQGPGIAAARMGHDVVMCPAQHAYLDMAHTGAADDWGAAWAAFVSLEDTVDWRVVPAGAEDIAPRIAGVQGTFWSEFTTADRQMEAMLAPRILGIAVKAWNAEGALDGRGLRAIAAHYGPLFYRMGWDRHKGA